MMNTIIKQMPRYESYKDSGVEWLGELPSHWSVKRLKFLLEERNERSLSGSEPLLMMSQKYGLVVRADFHEKSEVSETNVNNKIVHKNDLVFNKLKAHLGVFYKSEIDFQGSVSPDYAVYKSRKRNEIYDLKFLELLFRHPVYIQQFVVRATGIVEGLIRLYTSDLFDIHVPLPPENEQKSILDFLAAKTSQIDEAIAIKQKQIELLKERKQIIIQQALTQGLNPDVPVKDSGVDWIGTIPEHWDTKKLKYLLASPLMYGANESGVEYQADLPRYIRITDFSGDGKLSDNKKLSLPWAIGKQYLLKNGDILLARSGATVGKSYQFKTSMSSERAFCFAGYLIKATVDPEQILSDYLNLYLSSDCFASWKNSIFNKATIENIGADKYAVLPVLVPSVQEQVSIIEFVKSEAGKIDVAVDAFEKQVAKLKEYKTTLINSAVTGKIKVTELA